jgi:hypothetical protein
VAFGYARSSEENGSFPVVTVRGRLPDRVRKMVPRPLKSGFQRSDIGRMAYGKTLGERGYGSAAPRRRLRSATHG